MRNTHRFTIRNANGILAEWSKEFAYANAAAVLDDWQSQSFAKSFKSRMEENSDTYHDLLQSFIRVIEPFDCLLIAGWEPHENELSDVVAALFNPNWGHPFAVEILKHVLGALVSNGSLSAAKYESIQKSIGPERTQLFVRREHWGDSSRADIDVYTSGRDAFLVRIEHKIRGGAETFIRGQAQTSRLWKDAAKVGIEPGNVIGIFLSPGGEPAASRDFRVLSFAEFADAVCSALTDSLGGANHTSKAAESILGFMSYYRRM